MGAHVPVSAGQSHLDWDRKEGHSRLRAPSLTMTRSPGGSHA